MTSETEISENMLHAFVDGQLSDDDRTKVEDYLNAHPERAAEIADWSAQNEDIRALFPEPRVKPLLPEVSPEKKVPWMAIAASITLLWVGIGLGWYGRGTVPLDGGRVANLVQEAVAAHVVYAADPHRPVEVVASQEALLVRWLSKRVGSQLSAPDLRAQGFELVGGRLLSVSEGPAAQFMYEDSAGKRITLFAVKGGGDRLASFEFKQSGDTNSFYWADEKLRYTIIGAVARDTLNTLAVQVYNQLS